jgi:hypothetical protein
MVGFEFQESVRHMLGSMGGYKCALALAAHQQVFGCEFVNGFTYCALAHPKAHGQVHFAGNGFAGLPFAGLQTLQDQPFDLLVQRAKRRRGGCSSCAGLGAGVQ